MSETIKWSELTPMQRDDLIHEKVFGHQRQTATHTSRTRAGDSFSYSVTSWQTGGPDTPRYTRSMDAAWLVVEKMKEDGRNNGLFVPWQYHLSYLYGRPSYRDTLYDLNAEGVCIAALRAVGLQVEYEVQP